MHQQGGSLFLRIERLAAELLHEKRGYSGKGASRAEGSVMTDAPTHEEVVQSVMRQASQELITKINASHEECQSWANKLVEDAIHSINAARATGLYLIELQDQTPHGQWGRLFRSDSNPTAQIRFNDVTASRWMRLANAMPEAIKTLPEGVRHLTDMLKATGALPESQGHGEQTRHEEKSPFQSLVKFAGEMQGCLSQWRKQKPVTDWEPQLKDQVKSQLKPLVDFYQTL
jgi:hypothetical protein